MNRTRCPDTSLTTSRTGDYNHAACSAPSSGVVLMTPVLAPKRCFHDIAVCARGFESFAGGWEAL
jgi:hypothetical protein